MAAAGVEVPYMFGTMIEVPRAALIAGALADVGEFFSFGTNDLTQLTYGISRDDEGIWLKRYIDGVHGPGGVKRQIYAENPFEVLDADGVGKLMRIAVDSGLKARPSLKLGICGEHGGNPKSIALALSLGLHYVSCSPYRVPVAILAAAQAQLDASALQVEEAFTRR
jgi:pyruvate, orthophosphate dikinase